MFCHTLTFSNLFVGFHNVVDADVEQLGQVQFCYFTTYEGYLVAVGHDNADASIGMRFIAPTFDSDRAYGIVTELRDNPGFRNIEATFYDQLANFSQNVVDEAIRANASTMNRAGIGSRIVRVAEFKACDWCRSVAGNYDYRDVRDTGNDVWRRHENCRCTIDFITERNSSLYTERVNNFKT
jgi:hypothetical protein